jgi:hypothetical protein
MAVEPKILIIEDVEDHYRIVKTFVDAATAHMTPRPSVRRVFSKDEIEDELQANEGVTPMLIIFDLHIDREGSRTSSDQQAPASSPVTQFDRGSSSLSLDSYIKKLWQEPPSTWRGQLRIVVFTALAKNLQRLPKRNHCHVVGKIPIGAQDPFEALNRAIEDSAHSLI